LAILRQSTITCEQPLLAHLLETLGLKRRLVKNLLKHGAVAVNGHAVTQFDHLLAPGDELTVTDLQTALATIRLEQARIQPIYEDDALIVVDKPVGLLTVATAREKIDTLYVRLNDYLRGRDSSRAVRAHVVHRLDQETSGLVLFGKSEPIKRQLQEAWASVEKLYLAVVEGEPTADHGTISNYLTESSKSLKVYASDQETPDARLAITHYRVLHARDDLSLVEIHLQTGRKHQIRVHLAGLGCPVVGDSKYGAISDRCHRLALHASRLSLTHPVTGKPLSFCSPLPKPLSKLFPEANTI
jgi:23S rRNA pseudouridine1911/1915/1917 synthase